MEINPIQSHGDREFTVWDGGLSPTDAISSDRLYLWDQVKHDNLCQKYFGNIDRDWSDRPSHLIEAFLRDYYDCSGLVLCRVDRSLDGGSHWVFLFTVRKPVY